MNKAVRAILSFVAALFTLLCILAIFKLSVYIHLFNAGAESFATYLVCYILVSLCRTFYVSLFTGPSK